MNKKRRGRRGANFNGSNVILHLWIIVYLVDISCNEGQKLKEIILFKTVEQSKIQNQLFSTTKSNEICQHCQ